ncbi:MAG TPA: galactose oxidase-like domain-containing protein [Kofleriaceae bacterium]|nr:galactose oxidase-like domain-containing protein [Kofleriaceae bacterium]
MHRSASALSRSLVWILALVGGSGAGMAATTQSFNGGGTAYVASVCSAVPGPVILDGGPTGTGKFMRLVRAGDVSGVNSVAFQYSDPGAYTTITAQFDFRITPASPTSKADGLGFILLNTARSDVSGGTCQGIEEANAPGALGIGFDVYQNPGDLGANDVSVHLDGALKGQFSAGSVALAGGQWIHARIVARPGGGFSNVSVFLTPAGGAEVAVVSNLAVVGLVPFESRAYFAARTGGQSASHDLTNVSITYAADPAVVGQWAPLKSLPVIPIHSIMLPNQKILFWDRASAGTDINPRLLNPDGTVSLTPHPVLELFCGAHSLDAQGRAMIFGGHDGADGFGLATAFAYDHATNAFTSLPPMNAGRWYPTNTALANGDTLVIAGSITPGVNNTLPQVFEAKTETWRSLTTATRSVPLYPMMVLAPDGRVFNPGPNQDAQFLNTTGTGSWSASITSPFERNYGSAIMYDGAKLALIGGGYITNTVGLIDLAAPTPAWSLGAPMAYPRRQHNSVILADGNVLVTGGSKTPAFSDNAGAIFASEIWDPLTNKWEMGAAAAVSRLYHSESVLLPDGRVASLGGGHPAGANGGPNNFNMEYYSPPYLFKGARPTITGAPASGGHGQTVFVATPDGASIGKVHVIRLVATTHSFDQGQRINRLPFAVVAGGLNVTLPASSNLAPPGYYWLFIVKTNGVPSVGQLLSLQRPYQQEAVSNRLVAIEAERFHARIDQGGRSWNRVAVTGQSGVGAMDSLPNAGAAADTGYVTTSPRLDFWVNFTATGTHYVWVRMRGPTGTDDSLHAGLDGTASTTADRISATTATFAWVKATMDGPVATLNVPSTGLHRVSIWMREDGTQLDKLLLTTNAAYTPTGNGPVESAPY